MAITQIKELAKVFQSVDWIVPPYIQIRFLWMIAEAIKAAPAQDSQKILEEHLQIAYSPKELAIMLQERYSKIPHVREFKTEIAEAIEAFQMGLSHAAVATLIPVLEGVIRKISNSRGSPIRNGTAKLIEEIEDLLQKEKLSPHCYAERVVMLEVFQDFMKNRMLEHTSKYTGRCNLNRHGIMHGIFKKFGKSFNFYRLISLLDLLCFTITIRVGDVSVLAPSTTKESELLASYYQMLNSLGETANISGARV
jgi:high-affinity nickel permease